MTFTVREGRGKGKLPKQFRKDEPKRGIDPKWLILLFGIFVGGVFGWMIGLLM